MKKKHYNERKILYTPTLNTSMPAWAREYRYKKIFNGFHSVTLHEDLPFSVKLNNGSLSIHLKKNHSFNEVKKNLIGWQEEIPEKFDQNYAKHQSLFKGKNQLHKNILYGALSLVSPKNIYKYLLNYNIQVNNECNTNIAFMLENGNNNNKLEQYWDEVKKKIYNYLCY